MSRYVKALQCKCPKCEKGKVFRSNGNSLLFRMPKMFHSCQECGYVFEREPGFFFGAMYVSYALAVAELISMLVVIKFILGMSNIVLLCGVVIVAVLLSTFNFRVSRSLWMYFFEKKAI
ncbi:DUF983 domain-containing protein [Zhouia spongiae]|uniref:DUF983 domain-containing protein n=1 Tax=Zhouia spongiae TaxID=2202721 RepID=A0ABY3YM80_9FLAO|nr:DUF983 domain-containing protein [Zhouia spongiae]UNY98900.1 DUF983 domain-containing protein [Zhouia spongiae]